MDESCEHEEARLLKRTAQLEAKTRALQIPEHPFSQAEHDGLREELRQHQLALSPAEVNCVRRLLN
jgi:hypothetical protein